MNCAAVSCPPLQPWAFTADELDDQLDAVVRAFVADPLQFRLEAGDRPVLKLNKVLEWYGDDFGGEEGLLRFFASYLEGPEGSSVISPDTDVEFFDYDWTLNDISR